MFFKLELKTIDVVTWHPLEIISNAATGLKNDILLTT